MCVCVCVCVYIRIVGVYSFHISNEFVDFLKYLRYKFWICFRKKIRYITVKNFVGD